MIGGAAVVLDEVAVITRPGAASRQPETAAGALREWGVDAVFPALHAERAFSDGDLTQLANLCHNCRGCYYACQYTEPHEFALNIPAALANVRAESWERYAWPGAVGGLFQKSGVAVAAGEERVLPGSLSLDCDRGSETLRLELRHTKQQILEFYLNQIYLGSRAHGVKAAAHEYFGKDLRALTIAESALLADAEEAMAALAIRKAEIAEEIFVSDGAKCDTGNFQPICSSRRVSGLVAS